MTAALWPRPFGVGCYNAPRMGDERSLTVLLREAKGGDTAALETLIPIVYAELRRMAAGFLGRERAGHTLQPTALVHEAYIRLAGNAQPDFDSRAHFFGVAARLMRQILVDHARGKGAAKRSGGARVPMEDALEIETGNQPRPVLALADALDALEARDPGKARLIELKYFGGLTADESATITGDPVHAVRRELRLAQAWLQREMDRGNGGE